MGFPNPISTQSINFWYYGWEFKISWLYWKLGFWQNFSCCFSSLILRFQKNINFFLDKVILSRRNLEDITLVQFSHLVASDSLRPHVTLFAASQASLSITNSQSLLKLISMELVISSNYLSLCCPILLLSSSFPSIRVFFSMSHFFSSCSQSIRASASASVLLINIQDWLHLGLTGWISLLSKGLSRVFFNTTVQKHQFFSARLSLWFNSHIHTWLLEKSQPRLERPLLAK